LSLDELLLVTAGGIVVGFLGGYSGIGAAPVLVFVYGYFLGYTQHMAQGTVAAIMLGPLSLPAVIVMWDRVRCNLVFITIGLLTYAIFSYPGALLAYGLSHETLRLAFAAFLLILGVRSVAMELVNGLSTAGVGTPDGRIRLNRFSMTLLGIVVGVAGGFFGIGAGVLMVPVMIWLFGVNKDDARAISLGILLPPLSVGSVIKYQAHGDIVWPAMLVGLLAYMASNYFGARLGRKHSTRRFNIVLGVLLLLMGLVYGKDLLF